MLSTKFAEVDNLTVGFSLKGAHLDAGDRRRRTVRRSVKVLEYVPLGYRLSTLRKHLVPVLHFHRAALRAEHQLTDLVVPPEPVVVHDVTSGGRSRDPGRHAPWVVVVHDADDETGVTYALVRHRERERFVEHRIQRLLMNHRLLLLDLLALVGHPDLHVWI